MSYKSNEATFVSNSGLTKINETSYPADSLNSGQVTALQAIAAETPNIEISNSCGAFTTTSSSAVDITNLSVSFTVGSDDSYVEIGLIGDGSGNPSYIGGQNTSNDNDVEVRYLILRDSTVLTEETIRSQFEGTSTGRLRVPCKSLGILESPGAGTYTYKIQCYRQSPNTEVTATYTKLYVREIRR